MQLRPWDGGRQSNKKKQTPNPSVETLEEISPGTEMKRKNPNFNLAIIKSAKGQHAICLIVHPRGHICLWKRPKHISVPKLKPDLIA
jgi:hypothetical protein